MTLIREEGKKLIDAAPSETAVGNMVRRGRCSKRIITVFPVTPSQMLG